MGGLVIACKVLLSFLVAMQAREKMFIILARKLFLMPSKKLHEHDEEPDKKKVAKVDHGREIPH